MFNFLRLKPGLVIFTYMQCRSQAYWSRVHDDLSYSGGSTKYAKRQYHKARRRHDQQVIQNQLKELRAEAKLLDDIFKTNQARKYVQS